MSGELFYVLKEDSRVEGPWDDRSWKDPPYIPRQYRGLLQTMFPWQKEAEHINKRFEPRKVNCLIDPDGGKGKSVFGMLCQLYWGGYQLPPFNDHKELIQCICSMLIDSNDRTPGPIVIDLPRALTADPKNPKFAAFMVAIEEIKKGFVQDIRYKARSWSFDSPTVWVFANHPPNVNLMSSDRWNFYRIDHMKELERIPRSTVSEMFQMFQG